MIFVNGYPVLIAEGLESQIVLTDSAISEVSMVYMDKFHAPASKQLVWVQILNRKFDRSQDESDDNRRFEYEFWMWVDYVLSSEFPANYQYDESGDPIIDEKGQVDLGNWKTRPGFVKVYLREHKHVLTRHLSLDNVNIINRLAGILNHYNSIMEDPYLHMMDWYEIAEFLGSEDYRIRMDYEVEYEDEESTLLPSEYPPGTPVNCFWQQLKLSECLDDLVRNYDCRILTKTHTRPDDPEYSDEDRPLSYMQWRYRRKVEYDTSLTYTRINWPVYSEEQQMWEDASLVYVPTNYAGVFNSTFNTIAIGYAGNSAFTGNSAYRHICNLAVHTQTTSGSSVPAGTNEVTMATLDYVKNSHVNMSTYYAFETPHLPKSYYETKEWSRITIRANSENQDYLVEHLEREGNQFKPKYIENVPYNCVFTGTVLSLTSANLQLDNVIDLTNDIAYDGVKSLGPVNFGMIGSRPVGVGDFLTLAINGNTLTIIGLDTRHNLPDEVTTPMWFGEEVTNITWDCPDWSFNPGDEYFQHPRYADNPITYDYLKCFNYKYLEHELVGTTNQSQSFSTLVYEAFTNPTANTLFKSPTTVNYARVIFESLATEEEIEAYIDRLQMLRFAKDIPVLKPLIIADWERRFRYITFHIGFSRSIVTMDLFYTKIAQNNSYFSTSMHPDIIPHNFHRLGAFATELPYTWEEAPFNNLPGPNAFNAGIAVWEAETGAIEVMLYYGYLKRFNELPITVTVNT